jgi:PAS domain S-box-containing protein
VKAGIGAATIAAMVWLRSIRGRLILLVTLAALPALVLLGFSSWNTGRMQTEAALSDASRVAALIAGEHEQMLGSTFGLMRAMALTEELRGADAGRCQAFLQRTLRLQTVYIAFARLTPDGKVDCSSGTDSQLFAANDIASLAQGWDDEYLVLPYAAAGPDQQPVTLVTRRVMDAGGHVAGYLRAAIGLEWLGESFGSINLPRGSLMLVAGSDGRVLISFPERPALIGRSLADLPLGQAMQKEPQGAAIADIDGTERVFGFHPLAGPATRTAILVGVPKETALAIAFALQRYNLAAILIALVGVAVTTWFASNNLVLRWTDRMLNAARTVTAGQYLARVGGPYDRGELGELARSFDRMLDEVVRRERELQQREEWFRSVVQYSSDMITIIDGDGRYRYVSPAIERVLGYSVDQLQESLSGDLVHPDEQRRYGEIMRYLMGQPNRVAASEHRLRHADGRYIAIESLGVNLLDNPAVRGIVINSRDVTRRRRVEELLRLVTSAVDQAHDGVLITTAPPSDAQPQIVYVNPALITMTGLAEHELIGASPAIFDTGRDPPHVLAEIRECLAAGANRRFTFQFHTRDRRDIPIELHITALKDENGHVTHFVSFWRDITEQRQAESERERLEATLRQALKMEAVGTLAGGIAHDFNNVLLPMMMLTQLTISRLPADSRERQDLTRVLMSQKRAKSLVGQILAFSRGSSGEYGEVDLRAICQETLNLLRATLPATVTLLDRLADAPPVLADSTQVQQVLMNLCGNAAQAMPNGKGTITVSLDAVDLAGANRPTGLPPGRYCRLVVEDDGSGIAPDIIERIFDPFFTTKEVGVGTGLGLSVVHGIVTAHKGSITVTSRPEEGAAFTIYLPVAQSAQQAAE